MPILKKEYYLNSVADKIYINPVGEMDSKSDCPQRYSFQRPTRKTG
jgi:hypothetical protein